MTLVLGQDQRFDKWRIVRTELSAQVRQQALGGGAQGARAGEPEQVPRFARAVAAPVSPGQALHLGGVGDDHGVAQAERLAPVPARARRRRGSPGGRRAPDRALLWRS